MDPIYLDARDVPAQFRVGYSGTKFQVIVCESVTIPADAGLWAGGSRDTFSAMRVADGAAIPFPGQQSAPWDASRTDRKVPLQPGFAVREHSHFCGKDMGLTFYLHPTDAAPMLPAPITLTETELLVLAYTAGRKSSYMGRNRYQMAREDHARDARYARPDGSPAPGFPTLAGWDAAKASLVELGMLNRAGAITPAGRNANTRRI